MTDVPPPFARKAERLVAEFVDVNPPLRRVRWVGDVLSIECGGEAGEMWICTESCGECDMACGGRGGMGPGRLLRMEGGESFDDLLEKTDGCVNARMRKL
jgi:hypothetical protein